MKKILFIVKILLVVTLFTGCLSKDRAVTGQSATSATNGNNGSEIMIKTIFPDTPVITLGGNLKLTSIVTDAYENYLESTIEDPIEVTWSSSDESIATVNDSGYVYGKKTGEAVITAIATKANLTSEEFSVTVNVVNLNTVDVAEVYLSLSSAFIDINAERTFRLTAVDYSGAQTSLSEGSITFTVSNDNVVIDINEIVLTTGGDPVEVTLTGLSKGYTFITPKYSITENGETITITGTPLIVQVKDPVESSKPSDETVDAGQYLSMYIQEDDGKKLIHVGHYDNEYKTFKYSYFDGTWEHDQYAIPLSLNGGISSKVLLSPFSENRNRPMAVMLEDNKPVLWYQTWPSSGWVKETVSQTEIFDLNKTYPEGKRLVDATANFDSSDSSLNVLHIAYYNRVDSTICMVTFTDPSTKSFNECFEISDTSEITELSISMNRVNGEPRLIYVEKSIDSTQSGIYYVTVQSGYFYRERVTNTSGNEGNAVLNLDGNSVPTVFAYSGIQVGMYRRVYAGNSFVWEFKNLSGLDPIPDKISSVDFAFDSYNEPRVVFNSDDKIKYARRVNINGAYKWIIDSPGDSTEGVQGEFLSIFVDSSNRAHVVYSVLDKKWFSYWAEPNFFNYKIFPANTYTGADVIDEG